MKTIFDHPVPTRDGEVLSTDLYLPDDEGRYPVLLMRTPYGKGGITEDPLYGKCLDFTRHGYVIAIQDCRGTGASTGTPGLNGQYEQDDGFDSVEYLASLPFANGKVGMFGLSYFGYTQCAAASRRPPHLVCAAPFMCCSRETFGASRMHTVSVFHLSWAYGQILKDPAKYIAEPEKVLPLLRSFREKLDECALQLPLNENPAALCADIPYFRDYLDLMEHVEDREFWDRISSPVDYDGVHAPLLFGTGWHDMAHEATIEGYCAARASRDEVTREGARLLIGPWTHGGSLPDTIDGVYFGPDASGDAVDVTGMLLKFYDLCMKDEKAQPFEKRVRCFEEGRNIWHDLSEWPPEESVKMTLYPRRDGTMTGEPCEGEIGRFTYDPGFPMPSACRDRNGRTVISDRRDAVCPDAPSFLSEPAERDITLAGRLTLDLYAATTAQDTDFSAIVCDVLPDGTEHEIASSLVRAKYRGGMFDAVPIVPGAVTRYQFTLGNAMKTLPRGHRLRLTIHSSLYPRCNRSLNSLTPSTKGREYTAAIQTLYAPTRLEIDVLPV